MNEKTAVRFFETYVSMRAKQHQLQILLDDVYKMRSNPESKPMAATAQPRLEELRLDIEDAKNAMNLVADLQLHNEQLSYEREHDAIARDEQAMYDDLRHGG